MRELKLICLHDSPGTPKPLLEEPKQAFHFWQDSVTRASWFDVAASKNAARLIGRKACDGKQGSDLNDALCDGGPQSAESK